MSRATYWYINLKNTDSTLSSLFTSLLSVACLGGGLRVLEHPPDGTYIKYNNYICLAGLTKDPRWTSGSLFSF